MQKSRTINTEGTLGRDSYRKINIGLECELEEGETLADARGEMSGQLDEAINEEIKKIKTAQKKYKNF